ncbi:MAG TPA: DNA mismatch repair protein MutS [Candidatus Faecicola pullistercoris]|nr:DNA mismatch repair protein MutS [Candidatus Faecicola pullistercoris]
MAKLSPMMQQYVEMKEKYNDCILLYRLGDFYEMFFDDAKTASEFLGLTLTGRDCGLEERAPMCGVPHHAVEMYIRKLIEGGFKVAICEQLSDPAASKGMVDRDVIRVVTPGTVMEDNILEDKKSNYLACVFGDENGFGLAWTDISTGEFRLYEYKSDEYVRVLEDLLVTVAPAEIICNLYIKNTINSLGSAKSSVFPAAQAYYDWAFEADTAGKKVLKQLKTATLDAFECSDKVYAVKAAGALLEYLGETQKRSLEQINRIQYVKDNSFMFLDANTRRNLELTETVRDRRKKGSLLWLLDKTRTSMGGRELRRWVEQPLQSEKEINLRLDGVEEFVSDSAAVERLNEILPGIRDIERLAGRIAYGSVNPKDCLSLQEGLSRLPELKKLLFSLKSKLISQTAKSIDLHTDVENLLSEAIDERASGITKDGGYIKSGFNGELDRLRNAGNDGKEWLLNLETSEREATGIKNLKISYNKVFGYYIEVSKTMLDKVPFRYQRKQTIVNGERFITPELKEIEEKILGAEEKAVRLEAEIFAGIKEVLLEKVASLQSTARAVAVIDCLYSLAVSAVENKFSKPVINSKIKHISVKAGRHPVVEKMLTDGVFVANDTYLDCKDDRTMIITGPNMAGKSTYMRQVAVITLLAHIGSFVPAQSAEISLTDRIFTRVGASDDLISGQSTFMMEMIEVATILNNATASSLLILDEIGRGTSTLDGLSIAWAVIEQINRKIGAKTLFATHFHELTELEGALDGIKNYRILIKEIGGKVVFLHKIVRGGANKSFGIEVAALAGIPDEVVSRASDIMKQLEEADVSRDANAIMLSAAAAKPRRQQQLSLFSQNQKGDEIVKILKDLSLDSCTPLQAFAILMDLKEKADE